MKYQEDNPKNLKQSYLVKFKRENDWLREWRVTCSGISANETSDKAGKGSGEPKIFPGKVGRFVRMGWISSTLHCFEVMET